MNLQLFYFFCVLVFYFPNVSAQNTSAPPEIIAEGDQFYCPGDQLHIATAFDIISVEEEIERFYIQISTGYANGTDFLELTGDHENISYSFNQGTGKLTLKSASNTPMNYGELIAAVKDVVFYTTDASMQGEKYFSFTLGEANFLPSTGHYYEYVEATGITWSLAKSFAEARVYYGLQGYLATITSREEAQLSGEQADGAGWIGGSDAEIEGSWKWVTGPEAGMVFWNGGPNGSAPAGAFEFWNNDEPNNLGDEDYAHVTAPNVGIKGSWNDLRNEGSSGDYEPKGYMVEYGYGGPDDAPIFAAYTRIFTNSMDSIFSGSNCGPGEVVLRATVKEFDNQPAPSQVLWFDSMENQVPLFTGEDYRPFLTESTDYYVLASQNGCFQGLRKKVSAKIYDIPDINKHVNLYNCDADAIPNDGYTDFNLEEANEFIVKNVENNAALLNKGAKRPYIPPFEISYHLTEEDAVSNSQPLDPYPFNNRTSTTVYVRAQNFDGCFEIAKVSLIVSSTNPLDVLATLESCDYDDLNDGKIIFDLTEASSTILAALPDQDLVIQYYRNQEDAALQLNEIEPAVAYRNEIPNEQDLYVRIESLVNGECISVGNYAKLKVDPLPEFQVVSEVIYCANLEPITVTVTGADGIYAYEWTDPTGALISISETALISSGGRYAVSAISKEDCISETKFIEVRESEIATISNKDITVIDGGESNSIQIDQTGLGPGNYEYSLNDAYGPYQQETIFNDVQPGIHTLFIRDQYGCGMASIEVSVIGYPSFFTPNGDGYNDTWQVKGVSFQPTSMIYIYDKFGKLLAELDGTDEGWHGLYDGKQMPSTDYWYRVRLEDGRVHTGHFSLIRK